MPIAQNPHEATEPTDELERKPHSTRGASSSERWLVCPGSVALSAGLPNISSEDADHGTAAHEVGADCLKNGQDAWEHHGRKVDVTDPETGTTRSFTVDDDMVEAVQVYLDTIRGDIAAYAAEHPAPVVMFVEQGFHLAHIDPDLYGTADCVVYFPGTGLLRVYDYKNGIGVEVHVEENDQLQYYAVGAVHETMDAMFGSIDEIELVVVQPRCVTSSQLVHRWRTNLDKLGKWVTERLVPGLARTREANAPLVAGDHCKFCPAKQNGVCPVLNEAFDNAVALANDDGAATPAQLDTWELAERMALIPLVRNLATALEQEAFRRMSAGEAVPGFKLVSKKSNRVWNAGGFEAAVAKFGQHAYEEPKGKSPAQIEKLTGGKEFVPQHSFKPDTGLTIAPDGDRRGAVPIRPAGEQFAGIGK